MTASSSNERLRWVTARHHAPLSDLAEAVSDGLSAPAGRRSLPCRFFYDERGSALFEQICELPEYYPTRVERGILRERADQLAALFDERPELVELGSGSASKTRVLIEAFLRRHGQLTFVPIDISPSALAESASGLLNDHPELRVHAVEGEYELGLRQLHDGSDRPRLILWLGSSIGNLARGAATSFLDRVRATMTPSERLLVGIDLRKSREVLERAYDDARGVTARFNLNLLERINRELGGQFEPGSFRHRAVYDDVQGRVEMHLESRRRQVIHIEKLDLDIEFLEGERIHTENSYKYSYEEIEAIADTAGLELEDRWIDDAELFSVNLFRVRPAR